MAGLLRASSAVKLSSSAVVALLLTFSKHSFAVAAPDPQPSAPQAATEQAKAPSELAGGSVAASHVQPLHEAPGMVRVRLSAGEHRISVFLGRGPRPIADCASACEFWAWPGQYQVRVTDGEAAHADSTVPLRLLHSGNYVFVPANGRAQNAGLILGVSGPLVGVIGVVLTTVAALRTCDDEAPGHACERPGLLYVGLGGIALGAAMTATGWLMYAHHRAQFRVSEAASSRRTLALRPMHEGLGLIAMLKF